MFTGVTDQPPIWYISIFSRRVPKTESWESGDAASGLSPASWVHYSGSDRSIESMNDSGTSASFLPPSAK
jgi:hypothetical protein